MSRFTSIEITIDCNDLNAMFDFWQKTLEYIPGVSDLERYDKNERKYLSLVDPNKKFVKIILQKVDEIKTIKNRIHLDLHCDDIEKEVDIDDFMYSTNVINGYKCDNCKNTSKAIYEKQALNISKYFVILLNKYFNKVKIEYPNTFENGNIHLF